MSDIIVRRAGLEDVPAMSAVMIASITELCTADHRGDPALVAGWTRNKTPESVAGMLANPHLALFTAEVDGTVGAVGAVNGADTIGLNYVSPAFASAASVAPYSPTWKPTWPPAGPRSAGL